MNRETVYRENRATVNRKIQRIINYILQYATTCTDNGTREETCRTVPCPAGRPNCNAFAAVFTPSRLGCCIPRAPGTPAGPRCNPPILPGRYMHAQRNEQQHSTIWLKAHNNPHVPAPATPPARAACVAAFPSPLIANPGCPGNPRAPCCPYCCVWGVGVVSIGLTCHQDASHYVHPIPVGGLGYLYQHILSSWAGQPQRGAGPGCPRFCVGNVGVMQGQVPTNATAYAHSIPSRLLHCIW